jgi:hypothetical protein
MFIFASNFYEMTGFANISLLGLILGILIWMRD